VLRTLLRFGAASQLARPLIGIAQQAQTLAPTPACGAPARSTAAQTEGPFFMRSSPLRQTLLDTGMAGERLRLTGRVLDTRCQPIAKALLEFWQADAAGAYDNRGFTLRGHQFSDTAGGFVLDTVLPGLYPGRTRHIHVKVQAPGGRVLTTQLYFPGEVGNQRDGIFAPELLVTLQRGGATALAGFDFVLGA
jgi:protocatechuate 3,4-dioxygenase beta subunit